MAVPLKKTLITSGESAKASSFVSTMMKEVPVCFALTYMTLARGLNDL